MLLKSRLEVKTMAADERNQYQIIRKDARGCFVETKSDSFPIGKTHMEFAAYDVNKPVGQRFTNHVHIYIDAAEFLHLAHFILNGGCHHRMAAIKKAGDEKSFNMPLYQSLGGTSAARLAEYGRPRKDGMSQSRCFKLFAGKKADYLMCAESGAGETDDKGLIVPRYGGKPEQRVSVSISIAHLNELMLMTSEHYRAWLAVWYTKSYKTPARAFGKENGKVHGKENGIENGKDYADDTQMF